MIASVTLPMVHGAFTIERVFAAARSDVFAAWSDPEIKAQWFVGPETWTPLERTLDFRVGGLEVLRGRFEDRGETLYTARFHNLVSDRCIVYAYDMHINGRILSVSLASVGFEERERGTKMTFTEQAVYFGGEDGTESRRHGTAAHFDRLRPLIQR